MKIIFGFILFTLLGIAKGDLPKKVQPIVKVTDFICHNERVRSSLKEYLELEQLKDVDTPMFQQLKELLHEFEQIETNDDNLTDLRTKIFAGIVMAFGSLDMERVCSAAPSTQLLELISKMNFDSMDPTLLKNGIAKFLAIATKKHVNETIQWIEVDIEKGEELKCKRSEVYSNHIKEKIEEEGEKKSENADL